MGKEKKHADVQNKRAAFGRQGLTIWVLLLGIMGGALGESVAHSASESEADHLRALASEFFEFNVSPSYPRGLEILARSYEHATGRPFHELKLDASALESWRHRHEVVVDRLVQRLVSGKGFFRADPVLGIVGFPGVLPESAAIHYVQNLFLSSTRFLRSRTFLEALTRHLSGKVVLLAGDSKERDLLEHGWGGDVLKVLGFDEQGQRVVYYYRWTPQGFEPIALKPGLWSRFLQACDRLLASSGDDDETE